MALTQTQGKAWGAGGRTPVYGQMLVIAAVTVAVILAAIVVTSSISKNGANAAAAAKGDPFLRPAAIEFRTNEHGAAAANEDLSAILLRKDHDASVVVTGDPFVQPGAIKFRVDEHKTILSQRAPAVTNGDPSLNRHR